MTQSKTLGEWLDRSGVSIETQDLIDKHGHLEITEAFGYGEKRSLPFPQNGRTFRNVHNWLLLSDGSAVGWNESPRNGWSFPRLGKKTVAKNFRG